MNYQYPTKNAQFICRSISAAYINSFCFSNHFLSRGRRQTMPACGNPEKSAGLRSSLIFPTAAPTHVPFTCTGSGCVCCPARACLVSKILCTNKKTGTAKAMPVFLVGAEGLGVCCGVALHTYGSSTEILRISVPASPLFAKNSSLNCFLNAQTLSGSSQLTVLLKQKTAA